MTAIEEGGGVVGKRQVKPTRLQQEARIGWLFLSPWIVGFVFSLTDFKMLTPGETEFIGLENYVRFFYRVK